jgi:hypothetical protein
MKVLVLTLLASVLSMQWKVLKAAARSRVQRLKAFGLVLGRSAWQGSQGGGAPLATLRNIINDDTLFPVEGCLV